MIGEGDEGVNCHDAVVLPAQIDQIGIGFKGEVLGMIGEREVIHIGLGSIYHE